MPGPLFIVGNSRSGTTMMLRILNNHSRIYGLNELHFFENLWSSGDGDKKLDTASAGRLASRLIYIQRDGYIGKTDAQKYLPEGTSLIEELEPPYSGPKVFEAMMRYETAINGREIPCEKTPQNVFYLDDIFRNFPNARVLNMVRDPRAVMLSQKRKWRRRKMGADFITPWEVFRLRVNYHPITISRLWNSAQAAARSFSDDNRTMNVRFEDLMNDPESEVRKICDHFGVNYEAQMLDIPHASSSNQADSEGRGIDASRAGNWQDDGLNRTEIMICERMCGHHMKKHNYKMTNVNAPLGQRMLYTLSFPFKLALAILINLNRMKNIGETLRKRLQR